MAARSSGITMPPVEYEYVQMKGGLDLVTPTLSLPPGFLRDCQNFEISITGGYSRIAGYERYDGHPSPSAATYALITVNVTGNVPTSATITGQTSGATGSVLQGGGLGTQIIAYYSLTGNFQAGENVQISGVTQGSITTLGGAVTSQQSAIYTEAAADFIRPNIGAVPGSGNILGLVYLNNTVYAWRNNSGGTAAAIYKSSSSGWVNVPLGFELGFTGINAAVAIGATVTGGTSGATGVVAFVTQESGVSGNFPYNGRFILSSKTGTFQASEALKVGGVTVATCVGPATQISLLPNGRYEFVIDTFPVTGFTAKAYGCDGVNRSFQFDGTTVVPINSGMSPDTPNHVASHVNYLFLAFTSNVQFSSIGNPFEWSVITGAGAIAFPENVNCMKVLPGNQVTGALAIMTQNLTRILYGTGSTTFQLVPYNVNTGAYPYTAQNLTDTYFFTDRGVQNLTTTLNYGNFDTATLTFPIRPFIQARRTLATDSSINKEKGQYRVYFSDGYALYLTVANGQVLGAMPVSFPNPVICVSPTQTSSNSSQTAFFGSSNGFVYQLDVGTSFDGANINAWLTFVYDSVKNPRILKRWRKASLEVTGNGYAAFNVGFLVGYGLGNVLDQASATAYTANFQATFWDNFTWDNFTWDGVTLSPTEVELVGSSENIAITVNSNANYYPQFTINSALIHYSMRRGLR